MLVCLYPINVKTAELIGLNFFVGPYMTPGKVYGCSKLQINYPKIFEFLKNLVSPGRNIVKSTIFFVIVFLLYKEKMLTDRTIINS